MDALYYKKIQTKHFSPFSGGGVYSGRDGDTTIGGVKAVDMEILPEDPLPKQIKKLKLAMRDFDPYKRVCNIPDIKKIQF
tara:strand:+ start:237 stop:476 length:240 start_codon:yes stop_codon:yes gene_type:complete